MIPPSVEAICHIFFKKPSTAMEKPSFSIKNFSISIEKSSISIQYFN